MELIYEDVKGKVFCTVKIPEGYFGSMIRVGVALVDTHIIYVAPYGCFNSGLVAVDEQEAIWTLLNSPSSRAKNLEYSSMITIEK